MYQDTRKYLLCRAPSCSGQNCVQRRPKPVPAGDHVVGWEDGAEAGTDFHFIWGSHSLHSRHDTFGCIVVTVDLSVDEVSCHVLNLNAYNRFVSAFHALHCGADSCNVCPDVVLKRLMCLPVIARRESLELSGLRSHSETSSTLLKSMIYYDTAHLWGVLLRWHGSALNGQAPKRAFIMAIIALGVAIVNHYHPFVVATRESTAFTDSLTVFNTFLGLIVSFRMNSAFAQWRAGVVAVGSLSEAARDIVGSGCAYVSTTIKQGLNEAQGVAKTEETKREDGETSAKESDIPPDVVEKCTFFTELRRLVFLYIAIVFHASRGVDGIDRLRETSVLTADEYDELYACGTEHQMQVEDTESYRAVVRRTPHKLRATITELWLKRLVQVATMRGHLTLPNSNNLQQKIARLPNLYTTVFNIANVPIPFNYMQYLQFLLTAYMLLYIFVIVPRSGLYTPIWVFLWGTFLFMADEVAMEIECPFGLDANDIDLEARLLQIEEELTVLIRSQYYFVSGGRSLTRIPATLPDGGSWKRTPFGKPKPATFQKDFSFHQGRLSSSQGARLRQGSLPEISEFTNLIQDPSVLTSSKGSGYGSTESSA